METKKLPQFIAAIAASGGAFCAGMSLAWTSPVSSRILDEGQYFPITADQWSWIASIYNVGCAISSLFIGYWMDQFGRKWTMIHLIIPFLIGWSLLIWGQNFAMLFMGRLIVGIASGAFYISVPQYTTEISEKEVRGILGSFLQLFLSVGVVFVYVFGAYLTVFWLNVICGICPIIFGLIFVFMPESPFYLVRNNKLEKAKESLKWLRGSSYDPEHEIKQFQENLVTSEGNINFRDVFKKKSSIRALVIGFGLLYFRHMSCIIPILFFATTIFAAANVGLSADMSTIIIGIMQFISSFAASILVDRLGRRILLLFSIIFMTLTLFTLGAFFYIQSVDLETAKALSWLPLTSLCIYILAYPVGYGSVPWLVVSEVTPKNIKAVCGPIVGFFTWNFAFLISASFKSVMDNFGIGQTFWIFGGVSTIGIIFTYYVIPETKGKSLAEIENVLSSKNKKVANND